jgi:hypothetical protein
LKLAATVEKMQLKLVVKIKDIHANTLLDSDATENFMNLRFMKKAELTLQQKK